MLLTLYAVADASSPMARPLRIEYPDAYYHVMNRGLAHSDISSMTMITPLTLLRSGDNDLSSGNRLGNASSGDRRPRLTDVKTQGSRYRLRRTVRGGRLATLCGKQHQRIQSVLDNSGVLSVHI